MRNNKRTTTHTRTLKASKTSSESSAMEASCGDPESTGTGWVQDDNLLDHFGDKVGILL
jgi:hypothetical protein